MLLQGTAGEPLTPILSFKFLSPVRLKRNPVLSFLFSVFVFAGWRESMDDVGRQEGLCPPSWASAGAVGLIGPGSPCVWHREGPGWELCQPRCQEVPGALGVQWNPSSCQPCSMGSLGSQARRQELPAVAFPWLQKLQGSRNPPWAVQRELLGALVLLCCLDPATAPCLSWGKEE